MSRKYRIVKREWTFLSEDTFIVQISGRLLFSRYWIDYGRPCLTLEKAKEVICGAKNPKPMFEDKEVYNEK